MVTKRIMPFGLSAAIAVAARSSTTERTRGSAVGVVGGLLSDKERRSRHHQY